MTKKERGLKLFCPWCKGKAYPISIKDSNYTTKHSKDWRFCKDCNRPIREMTCWTTKFAQHYTAHMDAGSRNRYLKKARGISDFLPFLVLGRPASLSIVEGMDHYGSRNNLFGINKIGLMSHANTSDSFKEQFREFDLENIDIIKMVDSGVFTREGCTMDYPDLFDRYKSMGADYGIMIDHLGDKDRTLQSARDAMDIYTSEPRSFKLVGVAQGKTVTEYLECYRDLQMLGFEYIAIGGLLEKNGNWARVSNEPFMFDVVAAIRFFDPAGWLFVLGCYSQKRHEKLAGLDIFGSDSKAWMFKYEKQTEDKKQARVERFDQIRSYLLKIYGGASCL